MNLVKLHVRRYLLDNTRFLTLKLKHALQASLALVMVARGLATALTCISPSLVKHLAPQFPMDIIVLTLLQLYLALQATTALTPLSLFAILVLTNQKLVKLIVYSAHQNTIPLTLSLVPVVPLVPSVWVLV